LHDEVLDGVHHSVSSENSHDKKLLELVEAVRVTARHGDTLGLLLIVPVLPLLVEALGVLQEALEDSTQRVKLDCILPVGILQPGDGVSVNIIQGSVTLEEEVQLLAD